MCIWCVIGYEFLIEVQPYLGSVNFLMHARVVCDAEYARFFGFELLHLLIGFGTIGTTPAVCSIVCISFSLVFGSVVCALCAAQSNVQSKSLKSMAKHLNVVVKLVDIGMG